MRRPSPGSSSSRPICVDEGRRVIRDEQVALRDDVESLRSQRRRHDRLAHRHRLENLEARASADAKRNDDHVGAIEPRSDVIDDPGDLDTDALVREDALRRLATHDAQLQVRVPRDELREHVVQEEEHRVRVRIVVDGAEEEQGLRLARERRRRRSEEVEIDPVRHHRGSCRRLVREQHVLDRGPT